MTPRIDTISFESPALETTDGCRHHHPKLSPPGAIVGLEATWTLGAALQALEGDDSASIPFLVGLLENPSSRFALPGSIDLYRHDCLHLLLGKGFSLDDEAFVVGFSKGNDPATH